MNTIVTAAGARARITYEPYVRSVRVSLTASSSAPDKMISLVDLQEIFVHLKTLLPWLKEADLYYQDPPRGVESFGLCPTLHVIIPVNAEEPTCLPRD